MRYRILGVTQTADDQGTALSIPGARLRALLAALALRPGRTVPPEDLIDDIWTDAPPQDAHAALQALVGRLRRTVGKDGVTSEPGGYRLTATEDDVDLFVFERLVHDGTRALRHGDPRTAARALDDALALWRGPATGRGRRRGRGRRCGGRRAAGRACRRGRGARRRTGRRRPRSR